LKLSNVDRRVLVNVILIALVIVAVFGFDPVLKVVTGCTRMVVKGTSMLPTLKEGDLVFIREVNHENIRLNEVIVFDKYVLEPGDPDIRDIRIDPPWIIEFWKLKKLMVRVILKLKVTIIGIMIWGGCLGV